MSSGYSPWWRRVVLRYLPFLFRACKEGNYHWRNDVLCMCVDGEINTLTPISILTKRQRIRLSKECKRNGLTLWVKNGHWGHGSWDYFIAGEFNKMPLRIYWP